MLTPRYLPHYRTYERVPTLGDQNLGIDVPVVSDLVDSVGKLGTAVKWIGIGVLTLAAATVLFKAGDLFFGE